MRVFKDKATGKWKTGPNTTAIYETKEAAQWAQIESITDKLRQVRKKLEEGYKDYGK